MNVRAKCRVVRKSITAAINPYPGEEHPVEVVLQPVFGGGDDDANKQWSKYTPSGEIRLTITNPAAHEALAVGKAYFVDFTPAD